MQNKKGITLVEIILALAISTILIMIVAAVYFTQFRLFSDQNSKINAASQNKIALDEISNQIRESESVVVSCCSPIETTSSEVLVLRIWPINASGEPIEPNPDYDYIIYRRGTANPTDLVKITFPAAASSRASQTDILATSLGTDSGNLNFTLDDADPTLAIKVTINLTTKVTEVDRTNENSQSSTVYLRNK